MTTTLPNANDSAKRTRCLTTGPDQNDDMTSPPGCGLRRVCFTTAMDQKRDNGYNALTESTC